MSENIRRELLSDLQYLKQLEAMNDRYGQQIPYASPMGPVPRYLGSSQLISQPGFAQSQYLPQPQYVSPPQHVQPVSQPKYVSQAPQRSVVQPTIFPNSNLAHSNVFAAPPVQQVQHSAPLATSQIAGPPIQTNVSVKEVEGLRDSIKGESYYEYVPFEKVYYEQQERKRLEYVNVNKSVRDYYAVEKQVEYVPYTKYETIQEMVPQQKTEYLAQSTTEYVPQTRTEYVPVERVQEKIDYKTVKKRVIHYPEFDREFVQHAEATGNIVRDPKLIQELMAEHTKAQAKKKNRDVDDDEDDEDYKPRGQPLHQSQVLYYPPGYAPYGSSLNPIPEKKKQVVAAPVSFIPSSTQRPLVQSSRPLVQSSRPLAQSSYVTNLPYATAGYPVNSSYLPGPRVFPATDFPANRSTYLPSYASNVYSPYQHVNGPQFVPQDVANSIQLTKKPKAKKI